MDTPPDLIDHNDAATPTPFTLNESELYMHFDQPPDFTDESLSFLTEHLRQELDEPDLTLLRPSPRIVPADSPGNLQDILVLQGLKRNPGDDWHQVINVTNGTMTILFSQMGQKQVTAVGAYSILTADGDDIALFDGQAPGALGADAAHQKGFKGRAVKLCVIERVWNTQLVGKLLFGADIEDHRHGIEACKGNPDPKYNDWIAHSLATFSIFGVRNHRDAGRIRAMAPEARIIAITSLTDKNGQCVEDWPGAIDLALREKYVEHGDVLLLEAQAWYKTNEGTKGVIPIEMAEDNRATFNKIREAVGKGIIVIEPAGNWGVNIHSVTGNFPPIPPDKQRNPEGHSPLVDHDSGAIIVGARKRVSPEILGGTNSGERVDLHAWGKDIKTKDPLGNSSTKYGNTSGAAALIAGAAVLAQSAVIAQGKKRLDSLEMRHYLKMSGSTPIAGIGVMPNLERFITDILPELPQVG